MADAGSITISSSIDEYDEVDQWSIRLVQECIFLLVLVAGLCLRALLLIFPFITTIRLVPATVVIDNPCYRKFFGVNGVLNEKASAPL